MSTADGEIRPFRLFIVSFEKPVFVHDRQLAVNLPQFRIVMLHFFVASKVARYRAFRRTWALGKTLL